MMRSTASRQRFQGQKKKERRKPCIILLGRRAAITAHMNMAKILEAVVLQVKDVDTASQPHRHYRCVHACKVYDRLHAHVGIVILIVDYSS
jgi:hypothetical protein